MIIVIDNLGEIWSNGGGLMASILSGNVGDFGLSFKFRIWTAIGTFR